MTHIDEGTIHAWLDGALDTERSRSVEAHVHDCATCAAAVAEARGLIAASSRILGALDDVPANVIPPRAVAPVRPKRMWRAAPWVTGIAAVLVAAAVLRTTPEGMRGVGEPAPVVQAPAEVPVVAPGVADGLVPAEAFAARATERAAREMEPVSVTAAKSAEQAQAAMDAPMPRPSPLSSEQTVRPIDPLRDTVPAHSRLTGCYIVITGQRSGVQARDFAAAATRERAERAERADRQRTAPAAAVVPMESRVSSRLIIRLDSLQGEPGFIVRAASSDSSLGWWTPVTPDSARVDLMTVGVYGLTPAMRTRCPE